MPSNSTSNNSVYTGVIVDALSTAWRFKRYWLLAFFATALFTGGAMDVMFRTLDDVPSKAASFTTASQTGSLLLSGLKRFPLTPDGLINTVSGLQAIFALTLVILTILAFAVACQAGLVYAIGAVQRGSKPSLAEALRVGGSAFWPVTALNVIIHGSLWIVRFLTAIVVSMAIQGEASGIKQGATIFIFSLTFLFTYVANIVHVFSLNAMMLQGAHIREAIQRSLKLLQKHWLITLETAFLLIVIDLAVLFLVFGVYFMLALPFVTIMFTAAMFQSNSMFYAGLFMGLIAFLGLIFSAGGFTTQLKYAVWTYLYRRLGEGGAFAKIHRLARQLVRSNKVS